MARRRSALVIVAHTDDETLGCGGTIAQMADDGWQVDVVIVSDGLVTARGGDVQDNRDDCLRACKELGVGAPTLLGFPDQYLDRTPVADLSNAVLGLGLQPDLVITNSSSDLNQDHRIVAEVARIVGRPRGRPISILECEIPVNGFWNGTPFVGDLFVDVSATLERKVAAFNHYANEVEPAPSPLSPEGIVHLAQHHGMVLGLEAAESFRVVRAVSGLLP